VAGVGGGRHAFYQLDDVFLQRSGFAVLYDNLYNDCRGAEVFFLNLQLSYQPPSARSPFGGGIVSNF
jgi:hypothetical protein